MRTPASAQARASSNASLAGCTIASCRAEQAGEVRRRMHLGADLRRPRNRPLAVVGRLLQPVDLMRFGRDRQHPGALPFDVELSRSISACMPSRILAPIASSVSISLGQRAFRSPGRGSGWRRRSRRCDRRPPTRPVRPRSGRSADPDCAGRHAMRSTARCSRRPPPAGRR